MSADSSQAASNPGPAKQLLGGYELLGKIGQGAMGAVFKARQTSMDRVVALKVLPQRLARNKEFVARFLREARSAGRLNQPSIVQAFDAGEADGYYYIAMEYVDGPSVDALLKTGNALAERRALEIARDVAQALEFAHQAGLIHRDVKPANILLTSNGAAKLADLGLARESIVDGDSSLTNVGVALGTPDYMAPEQVRGDADIDGRCDIYSLGATLYHLLVGSVPFTGGTRAEVMSKHLTNPAPNARQANPQVSLAAAAIIRKAMEKQRDGRYADAGQLRADIDRALAGRPAAVRPAAAMATARPATGAPAGPKKNKQVLIGGGVAAAVLAIVLGIALIPSGKPAPQPEKPSRPANRVTRPPDNKPDETADKRLLTYLRTWTREHPADLPGSIKKYETAIARMRDTALRMQAKDDLLGLRGNLEAAAQAALGPLKKRAAELAKAGDYDGAIKVLENPPVAYAKLLAAQAGVEKTKLRAEAEAAVAAALADANLAFEAGRPEDGLARLDKLKDLRYARGAEKIRPVRAKLLDEKEKLEDIRRQEAIPLAKQAVEKLLADIETVALERDFVRIRQMVEAALKDEALQPAGADLAVVANVGKALCEIGERERTVLVAGLRMLMGERVALNTRNGRRTGAVKQVTNTEIVLDRTFKIGDKVHRRPDLVVRVADLTGATLERFRPRWTPNTPDERIAAAIAAMVGDNPKRMQAVLEDAKGHPLHDRYVARAMELNLELAESTTKWPRKRVVRISGNATNVMDVQVKLTFSRDDDMKRDLADLRFRDMNGHRLPYWVDPTSRQKAVVWVRVKQLNAGGTNIVMYYGNRSARPVSSSAKTFLFFDDFNGAFNARKWHRNRDASRGGNGAFNIKGAMLVYGGDNNGPGWVTTKTTFPPRIAVEYRLKVTKHSSVVKGGVGIVDAKTAIPRQGLGTRHCPAGVAYDKDSHNRHMNRGNFYPVFPASGVKLCPYTPDVGFVQSIRYNGPSSKNNHAATLRIKGKTLQTLHTAKVIKKTQRLKIHIRPWGWGTGQAHRFYFDWFIVRHLSPYKLTVSVGEELDVEKKKT